MGSVKHRRSSGIRRSAPGAHAPVRVVLSRSINAYAAPSAPLASTARFRRTAAYTRCLRCASRPRRPASGSVLSLIVPSRRVVLYDPVPWPTTLAFAPPERARHSQVPHHPLQVGSSFRGFTGSHSLRPVELLASLGGSDRGHSPADGGFYFRAFGRSVTLPAAGHDYGGNWASSTGGTCTRWNVN